MGWHVADAALQGSQVVSERYRKIKCPDIRPDVVYSASNTRTGEVYECADMAQLFKKIAEDPFKTWLWTSIHQSVKLTEEEMAVIEARKNK